MKRFALAMVCTLAVVGFVIADEFAATITKVEGSKVSFNKGAKKGDPGTPGSADAAADVKVYKGMFNADTKKTDKGEMLADGLKNEALTKIGDKGQKATITTDDKSGKITQIILGGGKGGGKKADK